MTFSAREKRELWAEFDALTRRMEPRLSRGVERALAAYASDPAWDEVAEMVAAGRITSAFARIDRINMRRHAGPIIREIDRTVLEVADKITDDIEDEATQALLDADGEREAAIRAGQRPRRLRGKPPRPAPGGFLHKKAKETIVTTEFALVNPEQVATVTAYKMDLITLIDTPTRDAVKGAISAGIRAGQNPIDIARTIRPMIGLSAPQQRAAGNFARALAEAHHTSRAKGYALRDKRFDRALDKAMTTGKPIPAKKIDEMVGRYVERARKLRSETIARTETIRAASMARRAAWDFQRKEGDLAGAVMRKFWLAAPDEKTRPSHVQAHADYADAGVDFDAPYIVGGARLMHPLDPTGPAAETINCRCTEVYRVMSIPKSAPRRTVEGEPVRPRPSPAPAAPAPIRPAPPAPAPAPPAPPAGFGDTRAPVVRPYKPAVDYLRTRPDRVTERTWDQDEEAPGWNDADPPLTKVISYTKDDLREFAQNVINNGDVYVRVPSSVVENIMQDGRLKSQFETGESGGAFAPKQRANLEFNIMGTPTVVSHSKRPIYGYISDVGPTHPAGNPNFSGLKSAASYGNVAIKLKKSAIFNRTSFTAGDSLDMNNDAMRDRSDFDFQIRNVKERGYLSVHALPVPINDLREADLAFPMPHSDLNDGAVSYVGGNFRNKTPRTAADWSEYFEAQVHGGVDIEDFEHIYFIKHEPKDVVRQLLKERGVTWSVLMD